MYLENYFYLKGKCHFEDKVYFRADIVFKNDINPKLRFEFDLKNKSYIDDLFYFLIKNILDLNIVEDFFSLSLNKSNIFSFIENLILI